jgi:hypothetical protein
VERETGEQKLNLFNQELLCAKNMQSIIGAAAAHLPDLGIAGAYLVTRDTQGALMFRGGFSQKKEKAPAEIIRPRRSSEIVPQGCFLPDRIMPSEPGTYFILPLFFESTDLGLLMVQAIDIDPSLYEEIRSTLSSALRGIMLFEEVEEARKRAERAERVEVGYRGGDIEGASELDRYFQRHFGPECGRARSLGTSCPETEGACAVFGGSFAGKIGCGAGKGDPVRSLCILRRLGRRPVRGYRTRVEDRVR